jgi:hypothetical protein
VVSTGSGTARSASGAARARLNCTSAITWHPTACAPRAASATSRSWVATSPASSAASAPSASTGITSTAAGNSAGIDASVGANVATRPMRPPRPALEAARTASSIIASFGFSTGISGHCAATASMHGPNAEQVNRRPCAPLPIA